ncbi:hypothetical protein [Streptomyces canus]|nr:hypothetical protein [Streptomyces canus]
MRTSTPRSPADRTSIVKLASFGPSVAGPAGCKECRSFVRRRADA